ncbi:MAG: potassium channel protein [Ignavibacteriales bacterium]|nr:potassium channel protein [Ignavibacteriales bacterium]
MKFASLNNHTDTARHLITGFIILLTTIVIGIIGFMVIEGWNFMDSLYMTMITITTTGFQEVHPLSDSGHLFTVLLIFMSFGTILYIGGTGVQYVIESKFIRRRRMIKQIEKFENHYIVCGFGRMGSHICDKLTDAKVPFVVIENNPNNFARLDSFGYVYDKGDAADDDTLIRVGIQKAKGLVAVLSNDPENVFATLSARVLSPSLFIVARAIDEDTESKLIKAGANRVVKPYELGGSRMAEIVLRPGVLDFIDVVYGNNKVDIHIEEITVKKGSRMHKKTLAELPLRTEFNTIIVAIQNEDKQIFIYNPKGDTIVDEGNKLIAIGEEANLDKLRDY